MCKKDETGVFLLSLLVILFFPTVALGANRDVCPSGCAYSSIFDAFSDASTGDVIRVAAGSYYETRYINIQDPITITIQGGWNPSFTSRSSDPSLTVVDMLNTERFLFINAADGDTIEVTVEGITITGGLTTGEGGAIYVAANARPTDASDAIVRCTLRGNRILGNFAGYDGGGVSAGVWGESDAFRAVLDLTVVDNEFIANSSMGVGGAIRVYGNSTPTAARAVLRYEIERNVIQGNSAYSASGLLLSHYRAAYEDAGAGSSISENDISGNNAYDTYAVYIYMEAAGSPMPLTIKNNRICNNSKWSIDDGGGLYLYSSSSSAVINMVNNTVSGNGGYGLKARSRGNSGVPDNFVLNLYNNIFHRNQPRTNIEEVFLQNSSDGNLVANAGSNIFTGSLSGAVEAASITFNDLGGNVIGDALLGDDFYPTASSPTINTANAAQAPATDMNGAARVGPPDIGALEYSGSDLRAVAAVPTGPVEVVHAKAAMPTVSAEPLVARPFACGPVDSGTVNLRIALPAFSAPVDVYAGISVPWAPDMYMITPAGGLALLSESLVKWKTAQTASVDQSFFGNLDASILPKGRYGLHLLVVPSGNLSMAHSYYESEMIVQQDP